MSRTSSTRTDLDREILRRAATGDAEAMSMLYTAYCSVVRGCLARIVGSDAAQDLSHEVFLRAFAHLATFRGESSLAWWLGRIAVNCGMRYLKQSRMRREPLPHDRSGPRPADPEDLAIESDDAARARRALGQLKTEHREILLLREIFGLPYEEIQRRLELKFLGTVRSRLHEAREALRRVWSLRGIRGG